MRDLSLMPSPTIINPLSFGEGIKRKDEEYV